MSKVSRNDRCPCGSGRKYKHCCLQQDEERRRAELQASNARFNAEVQRDYDAYQNLIQRGAQSHEAASVIWEAIQAGRLEEAEQGARHYIEHFTESPIGQDLMAYICEARGEPQQAAQWLTQVIGFMRSHPELFKPQDEARFQRRIDRLDLAR
jgi:hypothetical protein